MSTYKVKSIYSISDMFTDTLSKGGEVKLPVKGISMYPLIRSGRDYVVLKAADHVGKYDIVFYTRADGSYILHRIVGSKGNTFKLAGDSETEKELGVTCEQIIARAEKIIRGKRTIDVNSRWYKLYSRLWVFLMPVRPMLIRLWTFVLKIRRKLK